MYKGIIYIERVKDQESRKLEDEKCQDNHPMAKSIMKESIKLHHCVFTIFKIRFLSSLQIHYINHFSQRSALLAINLPLPTQKVIHHRSMQQPIYS